MSRLCAARGGRAPKVDELSLEDAGSLRVRFADSQPPVVSEDRGRARRNATAGGWPPLPLALR